MGHGGGRTGKVFGYEHYVDGDGRPFEPDFVCFDSSSTSLDARAACAPGMSSRGTGRSSTRRRSARRGASAQRGAWESQNMPVGELAGPILEKHIDALAQDPRVHVGDSLGVTERDGAVVLTGTVFGEAARAAAVDDARNTVGVSEVGDELQVVQRHAGRCAPRPPRTPRPWRRARSPRGPRNVRRPTRRRRSTPGRRSQQAQTSNRTGIAFPRDRHETCGRLSMFP